MLIYLLFVGELSAREALYLAEQQTQNAERLGQVVQADSRTAAWTLVSQKIDF
jgi:hypothetical protein